MRKWLYGLLVLVIAAAFVLWWYGQLASSPDTEPVGGNQNAATLACGVPAAQTVQAAHQINITGQNMDDVAIDAGQTVAWINKTDQEVVVRPVAQSHSDACAGFTSAVLQPSDELRFTFLRSGSWYFQINSGPISQIIVSE